MLIKKIDFKSTKLASDKLFVASNDSYAAGQITSSSVVRYGNLMGISDGFLYSSDKMRFGWQNNN